MSELRRAQLAVASMFVLNGGLFGAWASRIPEIQRTFQLDARSLGFYLLILACGAIMSFPVAGRLCDRLGAARTTKIVAIKYCPALMLIGLSDTPWMLAAAIFLFGAAHGGMDVAMNGWGAEVERSGGRSIMSLFHAMFSLGAGIGAGGGALAAWYSPNYFVHFVGFGLLASSLLLFTRVEWESRTIGRDGSKQGFGMPRGTLLIVAIIAFATSLSEGAMADWSAVFLTSVVNASPSEAALGYAAFSGAMVVMRLLGDRIVASLGPSATVRICSLSALAGSLIAVTMTTPTMVIIGFAFMGIGYSIVMPLVFSQAANDRRLSSGAAIAGVATFAYGGMLLGPPFIGFLSDAFSLKVAFGLFVVLAAVAFAGAGAFRSNQSREFR